MKFFRLITLFSLLFCFSCKTQKPASAAETPVQTAQSANTPKDAVIVGNGASEVAITPDQKMQIEKNTPYRLIVSFISIGEGTDRNGKEILDSFLNDWATKHKQEISYETVPWGREGEVDFCFLLSEIKDIVQQQEFVNGMKEKFKGHTLIQFTENEACIHKR